MGLAPSCDISDVQIIKKIIYESEVFPFMSYSEIGDANFKHP